MSRSQFAICLANSSIKRYVMKLKRITYLIALFSLFVVHATSIAAKDGQAYKDWKVQCAANKTGDSSNNCHIFQNLVSKKGNKRILHVAVGYAPGHKDPAAIITMPLGLSLLPGITIQVDDQKSKRFPFQACFKTGCQIGFSMNNKLLGDFKSGRQLTVTFFDLKQQAIKIPVSLSGFSAAMKTLKPIRK